MKVGRLILGVYVTALLANQLDALGRPPVAVGLIYLVGVVAAAVWANEKEDK